MRRLLVLVAVAACFASLPAPSSANAQQAGIQVALRALGLYCGPIDGIVGPQTVIAHPFGVTLSALAHANRLSTSHVLLIGKRLSIPGSRPTIALASTPTNVRDRLDYWADRLGVSRQLVRALAWMESGYQPN